MATSFDSFINVVSSLVLSTSLLEVCVFFFNCVLCYCGTILNVPREREREGVREFEGVREIAGERERERKRER